MKNSLFTLTWMVGTAFGVVAHGQTTTTYEDGPDGVRYQVTRSVVQRSIPTTEYQSREQKVYRPQVTTEYQSYQQTYLVPVTEYQWESHLRNWWNPFDEPYWTHELRPVTRWEARPTTVQIPVARTNWVEGTQVTQVPVTTYRTTQEEHLDKVAIGVAPTNGSNVASNTSPPPSVASRPVVVGSQQYQSDPPRSQSPWR